LDELLSRAWERRSRPPTDRSPAWPRTAIAQSPAWPRPASEAVGSQERAWATGRTRRAGRARGRRPADAEGAKPGSRATAGMAEVVPRGGQAHDPGRGIHDRRTIALLRQGCTRGGDPAALVGDPTQRDHPSLRKVTRLWATQGWRCSGRMIRWLGRRPRHSRPPPGCTPVGHAPRGVVDRRRQESVPAGIGVKTGHCGRRDLAPRSFVENSAVVNRWWPTWSGSL
jgi:hypothetical protein